MGLWLVVDEACPVTCSMPTTPSSLRGWGCFGLPAGLSHRCIPVYGLQPGATWRSFCAPSSVDELAAAVAGCRHSLLHDELSCGQWEAVDRRHSLCVIRTDPCAVPASAAADGCQLL